MLPLPAQRWALLAVLCLSLAASLAILATRNIYDDELGSFEVIPRSVPEIWKTINSEDVHPPGAYVLSHWAWVSVGDERWMAIVPTTALYFALSVFAWRFGPYFAQTWSGYLLFLLLVLFHPQILMWGNSIRWYPYWTSLSLLLLTGTALRRRETSTERPAYLRRSILPGVAEGVVLALMFYLNYLTLFYAAALCAMILLLWGWTEKKAGLLEVLAVLVMMALLAIPQWSPLINFAIPHSAYQRASIFASGGHLALGLSISEALLPWQPVAIVFFFFVLVPLVVLGVRFAVGRLRLVPDLWLHGLRQAPVLAIVVFGAMIVAAAVITGIGFKARSFLILTPWVAAMAAWACNQIRWPILRNGMLAITCLWVAAGATNLLTKQGTAKAGLNDHPAEVVDLVRQRADGKSAIIFCHDPVVAYCLNRTIQLDRQPWSVCSLYNDFIHHIPAGSIDQKSPALVFVVHSYGGSLLEMHDLWNGLTAVFKEAEDHLEDRTETRLSHDPDAALKRHIPGMGGPGMQLPDDRFIVVWGHAQPGVDWASLAGKMRRTNPGATNAFDSSGAAAK